MELPNVVYIRRIEMNTEENRYIYIARCFCTTTMKKYVVRGDNLIELHHNVIQQNISLGIFCKIIGLIDS